MREQGPAESGIPACKGGEAGSSIAAHGCIVGIQPRPDPGPPTPNVRPERFLVIKLADLGDALTVTPALRALRTTFPSARTDVLVTPAGAAVLAGLDSIDRCVLFEKAPFDRLRPTMRPIAAAVALGLKLRRGRYDRVFLLHHLFTAAGRLKYAALLGATGAPWRAGIAEDQPAFLTDVLPDGGYGVRHEADYWLDVVGLVGAANPAPRIEVQIGGEARARASRLLDASRDGGQRPRIALYPGAGSYSLARRWPADRFAEVARRLVESAGAQIVVVGGRTERELAESICASVGRACRDLAGLTDVKTLAAVLSQCDLFVGNDGGVMHLAVAAAVPTVAVFGPSNDISWGPYGGARWQPGVATRSVVVRADLACAPCMYRGYLPGTRHGCRDRDCLTSVGIDTVLQAAHALLTLT